MSTKSQATLLNLQNLRISFPTPFGTTPAVDGISIRVDPGATVALVGESGCGKSVTALAILRLLPVPPARIETGRILFSAGADQPVVDLLALSAARMRAFRGNRIAMIFQEPMTALNPLFTVGEQIIEAIELHQPSRGAAARREAVSLLDRVGIAAASQRVDHYPHQLSGGMRQRVMIAMALACKPNLLIADEPTTALDVTVQFQILELLREVQRETGMSILLITHDMGVVARVADYVYVMYAGRIVEEAAVHQLLTKPLHPYTRALFDSTPRLGHGNHRLNAIPGAMPELWQMPGGCRFHPRCQVSAQEALSAQRKGIRLAGSNSILVLRRCVEEFKAESSGVPLLNEVQTGHFVACWEVPDNSASAK